MCAEDKIPLAAGSSAGPLSALPVIQGRARARAAAGVGVQEPPGSIPGLRSRRLSGSSRQHDAFPLQGSRRSRRQPLSPGPASDAASLPHTFPYCLFFGFPPVGIQKFQGDEQGVESDGGKSSCRDSWDGDGTRDRVCKRERDSHRQRLSAPQGRLQGETGKRKLHSQSPSMTCFLPWVKSKPST